MEAESKKYKSELMAQQFVMNLQALRVFNSRIGSVAAEHDRSAMDSLIKTLKSLIPAELFSEEKEEEKTADLSGNHNESITSPSREEMKTVIAKELFENPENKEKFLRALNSYHKAAPVQEELLSTSVLVSLISYLEALISNLIHAFYERFPKAMPAEDRSLSLAELREIGSVKEAEAFLVAKEVDSVLRQDLDSQFRYFTKRLKIDLTIFDDFWPIVIETDQRRNLIVHNQGIVNRVYLERVDPKLVEKYGAVKNERLPVEREYLSQAITTIEIVGIILLQQCWRKWDKDTVASADDFLIDTTFDGLLEERYELVDQIARYASTVTFENDVSKRIVCINQAITLRDSGRSEEIEKVLESYDWSACGLIFQVALCAVRKQEDELFNLLPRAVAAGELKKEQLEQWPLFHIFRSTERFSEAIKTLFVPK
ncbi:MAG: hypothetical protein MCM46_13300 [Candidatus Manganitrophus sp. SB1]|nr:hypothetical protein [Candidatus Manganitrophus morganii]